MNFKEKTEQEISQMDELELATYFKQVTASKNADLELAIKNDVKEEISKLRSEITAAQLKSTEAIQKSLEAQGLALSQLTTSNSKTEPKGIKSELFANKDSFKTMKENGTGRVSLKAMTVSGNAPTYSQGLVENGMTRLSERKPFMQNIMNSGSLGANDRVIYFEQANRVGDAGLTAEGVLKNTSEFDLVERVVNAAKITQYIKVSKEMIDDIDFMESEIRNELVSRISLKVDNELLTGIGALKGVLPFATGFNAGSFALNVANANRYDVLAIAINQVYSGNYVPNYIVLNPTDVAHMDVTKGTNGQYVMPAFVSADGNSIKQTPIIMNTGVPVGQYLVMDSTRATVFTREALNITIGYENDDFTKNMVTILAEWRGLNRMKANEAGAFVKGTFATDIAAILKA